MGKTHGVARFDSIDGEISLTNSKRFANKISIKIEQEKFDFI
jgi:hypothetical protein